MASVGQLKITIDANKKVYFASDLHLGAPNLKESHAREKHFIKWLDIVSKDASAIFILGDLFDFWFEYKEVVPKGFVRVLGMLANIVDSGIPIYFFRGNHDLWVKNYLKEEVGLTLFNERQNIQIGSHQFLIGHGDGLGPKDKGFKYMKKVFINPVAIKLFGWLHPDLGVWLGKSLSLNNKMISGSEEKTFLGSNQEWLALYAKRKLEEKHFDYFIFGHRHLPMEIKVGEKSTYINIGDWISHFTYGVYDGDSLKLKEFEAIL